MPNEAVKEIILDGVRLPLAVNEAGVTFSDLARFQQKILIGDPSKDDNDLLSSWQMDDFSGGHGVIDMKEGTDQGRMAFSTIYGRFPGQLTKPPYSEDMNGTGTGNKVVLGEMWSAENNRFDVIYTAGTSVRRGTIDTTDVAHNFDALAADVGDIGTLTLVGPPVNNGVSFQGAADKEWFFIPCGNTGYAWVTDRNDDTTVNEDTTRRFSAFAVWDNKLIGITTGGRIYYTLNPDENDDQLGTVVWTLYDSTYALSKSYRVRGLINFYNKRDEPCLYIITDRDIWQFDPDGPELFRIESGWPSHPWHGKASCVWNGQLYISIGMGVMRYTGGAWMPVGLDRDNGLPAEYQGYITDLVPGYNAMYALVQGVSHDSVYGSKSSIHEYSGSGWQCVWTDDSAVPADLETDRATLATSAFTMGGMILTGSANVQTLIFATQGSDDTMYCMPLSLTFANPRAGIGQEQLFGPGDWYFMETSEFDAGKMIGYIKIGNAIQIYLEEPVAQDPGFRDDLYITARVDRGAWGEWQQIETMAGPGRYVYPLGAEIDDTDPVLYEGLAFERIQFRIGLKRQIAYNADKPTVITNFVFSYLPTVSSNDAFTCAIDCSQGSGTYSPMALADFVDELTSIKRFCVLTLQGRDYRVFVSQNKGKRFTGADSQKNIRELSIIEIPLGLSSQ